MTTWPWRNEIGGYEAADARADALDRAYGGVARLLGGAARLAMAAELHRRLCPGPRRLRPRPRRLILTSRSDYASNQIMYLSLARRRGVEVVRAPDAPEGGIDPERCASLVGQRRPDARRPYLGADQLRAGPAGRGGRRDLPGGRCALSGRRLSGRGPDADRRRPAALRLPRRHGRENSSRAARHRLPLRVRPGARRRRPSRSLVDMHGATWTDPDASSSRPMPGASRSGRCLRPGAGTAAPPRATRSTSGSRRRAIGARALAAYARERLAAVPECGCSTAVPSSAPS